MLLFFVYTRCDIHNRVGCIICYYSRRYGACVILLLFSLQRLIRANQINKSNHRSVFRWSVRGIGCQIDNKTDMQADTQTDTHCQADTKTDTQADTQTGSQAATRTNRLTYTVDWHQDWHKNWHANWKSRLAHWVICNWHPDSDARRDIDTGSHIGWHTMVKAWSRRGNLLISGA